MTDHKAGTREEWLAARLDLLEAEKALTRRSDELAQKRQELPWVRTDKEYKVGATRSQRGRLLVAPPRRVRQMTIARA
jgi:predicted dithiol-disulfide oxidoreductase (DUF899 family)